MSQQAAEIAHNYAWEKIATSMNTVYKEVLELEQLPIPTL
jgi:hypothetical protein